MSQAAYLRVFCGRCQPQCLPGAAQCEGPGRHVGGDHRAGASGRTIAKAHGRYERAVGADEHVFAQHRAELVRTVVVAGDGAGADVGPGADIRIAQIGQVSGFRALTQLRVLHLDEVADVRLGTEHRAGTQAGKGTAIGTLAELGAFKMAVGLDHCTTAQRTVADHAVGTDLDAILDDDLAFENHVDVDQHVTADSDLATQIEARRIAQRDPLGHQPVSST